MSLRRNEISAAMRILPLALLAAAFALAGCGDILPKPAPPPALYRLTAAAIFPPVSRAAPTQLQIEVPQRGSGARYHAHRAEPQRDDARLFRRRCLDGPAAAGAPGAAAGELPATRIASSRSPVPAGAARTTRSSPSSSGISRRNMAAAGPPQWRIELSADLIDPATRSQVIATRCFTGEVPAAAERHGGDRRRRGPGLARRRDARSSIGRRIRWRAVPRGAR